MGRIQRADSPGLGFRSLRALVPTLSLVLALIISCIPLAVIGQGFMPGILLMTIFFWGVERPGSLPSLMVFLSGLLIDFVSGGPVGLWAVSFLLFFVALRREAETLSQLGFSARWMAFCTAVLLVGLFAWAVASLYYFRMLPPGAITWQVLMTMLLYPLWIQVLRPLAYVTVD